MTGHHRKQNQSSVDGSDVSVDKRWMMCWPAVEGSYVTVPVIGRWHRVTVRQVWGWQHLYWVEVRPGAQLGVGGQVEGVEVRG